MTVGKRRSKRSSGESSAPGGATTDPRGTTTDPRGTTTDPRGTTTEVRFRLRIGGEPFDGEASVPAGAARVQDLLPAVRVLADGVVARARAAVESAGRAVSCRAGCGACCRQPVPIAEAEATRLAALVAGFDEPRRAEVRARFAAAVATLSRAGLLDRLRTLAALPDADARQALARAYFDLGVACPFLDDESCSIHLERPIACREYLVTSDARHCADPHADAIELVPMPARPSVALFRLDDTGVREEARPTVLVLALEQAAAAAPPAPTTPGPQLFEQLLRALAGSR